jgi:lipid II:glycine glycyltransferase (peptidoglycan interpeptide bridge formation enzyme)
MDYEFSADGFRHNRTLGRLTTSGIIWLFPEQQSKYLSAHSKGEKNHFNNVYLIHMVVFR